MLIQLLDKLVNTLKKSAFKPRIIFPEGKNILIQNVAKKLTKQNLAACYLVFHHQDVNLNLPTGVNKIIIEETDTDALAEQFFLLKKSKISNEKLQKLLKQNNYFAMMMLHLNYADCFLGGIDCNTSDILLPAFQIIKTKTHKKASSAFLMGNGQKTFLFADCALTVNPTADDLVNITENTMNLANQIGFQEKKIALLSFSTTGSNKSLLPALEKVRNAYHILLKKQFPCTNIIGEIQFDAAFSESIRAKKSSQQKDTFSGSANIFIFPDLNSGNIGYKIAQQLGNYMAVGPIVIGLNKPVNDLSRGATENDIYQTAIVTLSQVLYNIKKK